MIAEFVIGVATVSCCFYALAIVVRTEYSLVFVGSAVVVLCLNFINLFQLIELLRCEAVSAREIASLELLVLVSEDVVFLVDLNVPVVQFIVQLEDDVLLLDQALELVLVQLNISAKVVLLLLVPVELLGVGVVFLA